MACSSFSIYFSVRADVTRFRLNKQSERSCSDEGPRDELRREWKRFWKVHGKYGCYWTYASIRKSTLKTGSSRSKRHVRVSCATWMLRVFEIRKQRCEGLGVKRRVREKIEIDRGPMSYAQCQSCDAVNRERLGCCPQFRPKF